MGEATEDAPQESVQAAAPTKTPVWKRRLWLAGRVGVTVGAVGFALAAWAFFVRVSDNAYVLKLNPGDVDTPYQGGFAWALLSVFFPLLLPIIWLDRSSFGAKTAASILAFLALFAGLFVHDAPIITFGRSADLIFVDGLTPHHIRLTYLAQTQSLPGYYAALTMVFITLIGGLLLTVVFATGVRRNALPALPRLRRLPGAGALTLGLVVFLIGILEMGWAAVNCTATPLFVGQCKGLSFSSVLHYGIATHTNAFDPVASLYAIPTLLVGGAALALAGVWWWRRLTPGLCLWITLYLAAATFFFVVAYAGVGAIVTGASTLGLQAGRWTGQIGIVIAGAGLVIGWGAAVVLWVRALRPGVMEDAAPSRP